MQYKRTVFRIRKHYHADPGPHQAPFGSGSRTGFRSLNRKQKYFQKDFRKNDYK